ncbi:hypothetical protein T459_03354 [Capsicum annuum]|uniref:C2 NT-type domain-containing protein n=1 Tax=Capsicum annuum TaxID=4072 RepID=A0A2G3AML0_CAPAN|nr:uncharacterized protein LOC107846042 [Capsicum annuum]PHT95472.1 hypothetical protein T459_03354 [Capsicum annuum]
MVVKMMKWRPWPPLISKKFEVKIFVGKLENLVNEVAASGGGVAVEIRWKGPPKIALSSFRKTVKRNCTREELVKSGPNGVVLVEWDEEFQSLCSLSGYKDNVFHPWEIAFTVLNGMHAKNKAPIIGTAVINVAEFAAKIEEREFKLNIPLVVPGGASETRPMLCISLSLFELRDAQESAEFVQRPLAPVQSPAQSVETPPVEKDELSALKAGLRKVKIFTEYVSTRRAKKACREEEGSEERCSARSEEGEYAYPFDSDSSDEYEEGESDEGKEDPTVRKSFSYGPLAYTNCAGVSFHSSTRVNGEGEDWVYFSNRRSDVGCSQMDDHITCASDLVVLQNPKRSILPWRKRKLSFRSPKSKGEPLLKKDNGEEGGDDIDFDRRQLSSDESLSFGWHKVEEDSTAHRSSVSEFGDDNFAVGCWEQREIVSRDGHMKLQTQIFFASIDQRSERAAGESACTALVAVLADWLQNNRGLLPIKSQFDSLIREGSLEWRKLCENETYRERFPDKHFDLETVLQAKIRSISVVPGKSFVGFFHPDGMDEGGFDFLHGAMSFDNIWDEISRAGLQYASVNEPQIYIVSWNDHFFVLKVEPEAYYIIDTLGERLYEGCNQAYILKFNKDTAIYKQPNTTHSAEEKPAANQQTISTTPDPKLSDAPHTASGSLDSEAVNVSDEPSKVGSAEEIVCRGKESCKDYIKSFLAAIPIRELQADIKKGLITSTPLHQRLQIELHFTHLQQLQSPITPAIEIATAAQEPPAVAMTEISA